MKLRHLLVAVVVGLCAVSAAQADVRLANIFSDNMVLQQGKPLRIWGWAEPGEKVTVTITESEQEALAKAGAEALNRDQAAPAVGKKGGAKTPAEKVYKVRMSYQETNAPVFKTVEAKTKADASGLWVIEAAPLTASFAPKYVVAAGASGKAAIQNVLVGEVWACAGQSNMFYSGDKTKWLDSEGLLPSGVRYAHTGRNSSYKPADDLAQRVSWNECVEENTRGISTIPYLFGKFLHTRLRVPVGIINAASGGAMGHYWCSLDELHKIDFSVIKDMMAVRDKAVADWDKPAERKKILDAYERQYAEQLAQWDKDAAEAKAKKKRVPAKPEHRPPTSPKTGSLASFLYNARIAPIGRLPIRGAIYLQGEQQVLGWAIEQYRYTFPAVIRSFREAFGEELPFGIITLQGAAHTKGNLGEIDMSDRSSVVREIHYRTHLATPNTGFICAADVGLGLHPNDKRPVAERAAYWALRDIYKEIGSRHMSVKDVEFKDGRALVHVEQARAVRERDRKTGKTTLSYRKAPVKFHRYSSDDTFGFDGFMIAGADRRWYPGKIRIDPASAGVLEIYSDLVDEPVAIRYGWGSFPHANVGLWEDPLPPFRTDDWPLPKGQDLTPEDKGKARAEFYGALHKGFAQMLDRKIRQGRMDAAISEMQLYDAPAAILNSKADRIEAILNETAPGFFNSTRMLWKDDRDWKTDRVSSGIVAKVPAKAAQLGKAVKDEEIVESIKNLRKALEKFRAAVQKQKASAK